MKQLRLQLQAFAPMTVAADALPAGLSHVVTDEDRQLLDGDDVDAAMKSVDAIAAVLQKEADDRQLRLDESRKRPLAASTPVQSQQRKKLKHLNSTFSGPLPVAELGDSLQQESADAPDTSQLASLLSAASSLSSLHAQSLALFEWANGPLIRTMQCGHLLLIDEISLANDATLERLNPVLEPGPLPPPHREGRQRRRRHPRSRRLPCHGHHEPWRRLRQEGAQPRPPQPHDRDLGGGHRRPRGLGGRGEGAAGRRWAAEGAGGGVECEDGGLHPVVQRHAGGEEAAVAARRPRLGGLHRAPDTGRGAGAGGGGRVPARRLPCAARWAGHRQQRERAAAARCQGPLCRPPPPASRPFPHGRLHPLALPTLPPLLFRGCSGPAPCARHRRPLWCGALHHRPRAAALSAASLLLLVPTPHSNLQRVLRALHLPRAILLEGSPGVGKCFARGTQVRLFDGGLVAVEDVLPGLRLMGDDGAARLVTTDSLVRGGPRCTPSRRTATARRGSVSTGTTSSWWSTARGRASFTARQKGTTQRIGACSGSRWTRATMRCACTSGSSTRRRLLALRG